MCELWCVGWRARTQPSPAVLQRDQSGSCVCLVYRWLPGHHYRALEGWRGGGVEESLLHYREEEGRGGGGETRVQAWQLPKNRRLPFGAPKNPVVLLLFLTHVSCLRFPSISLSLPPVFPLPLSQHLSVSIHLPMTLVLTSQVDMYCIIQSPTLPPSSAPPSLHQTPLLCNSLRRCLGPGSLYCALAPRRPELSRC